MELNIPDEVPEIRIPFISTKGILKKNLNFLSHKKYIPKGSSQIHHLKSTSELDQSRVSIAVVRQVLHPPTAKSTFR